MSKKIDFFNKDNKLNAIDTIAEPNNMGKNTDRPKAGSKTSKKKVESNIPKRRGRRPKKILENTPTLEDSPADTSSPQKNNSAVILRLNIDPSKLKLGKKPIVEKKKKEKTIAASDKKSSKKPVVTSVDANNDDVSSEGMFRNDIPGDNTCHKCNKNEKLLATLKSKLDKYEKKDKMDKSNKIYSNKINFISFSTDKKIIIKKTDIKCWWDTHKFTNLPCFLPELFHDNTYHVTGCFCSFNCALAYNLYYKKDSKIDHRKTLIYKLYREMYGLSADDAIEIKEAPPKEILDDFGGDMSIDTFRRSFIMINKEYIIYIPPLKPINIIMEERNIEPVEDNDNEFVIKRSKPFAGKRSVMTSMKMAATTGDSD